VLVLFNVGTNKLKIKTGHCKNQKSNLGLPSGQQKLVKIIYQIILLFMNPLKYKADGAAWGF
jgi:hypothetical protein